MLLWYVAVLCETVNLPPGHLLLSIGQVALGYAEGVGDCCVVDVVPSLSVPLGQLGEGHSAVRTAHQEDHVYVSVVLGRHGLEPLPTGGVVNRKLQPRPRPIIKHKNGCAMRGGGGGVVVYVRGKIK